MDIGKKLKELRLQNDLTLGDLASRSELTKGFLSQVISYVNYINGMGQFPLAQLTL